MDWRCWKINNAGEGDRGESVLITSAVSEYDAASQAAEYFDDLAIRRGHMDIADTDGETNCIEVIGNGLKPMRLEVKCELVRKYRP